MGRDPGLDPSGLIGAIKDGALAVVEEEQLQENDDAAPISSLGFGLSEGKDGEDKTGGGLTISNSETRRLNRSKKRALKSDTKGDPFNPHKLEFWKS